MKTEALWTDQAPRPSDLPSHDLPAETDIAIIGGGYTGLNAAIVAAKAGASVTVLEQNTIGWGASSRNGGMLTPGLKAPIKTIMKRYGKHKAKFFWQWALDAIDHIDTLVKEERIDCDYARNGHVYLAHKHKHVAYLESYQKFLAEEMGYTNPQLVNKTDLHTEIGSPAFHAGLADDYSAGLQPAKYVYGLGKVAAKYGACLAEEAGVNAIQRRNGHFEIHTAKGQIKAGQVLLATNGYTATRPVRKARHGIFPVGSYIVVTEPLPKDIQTELSPKGRMFYDSKSFLNYFRLTPDGRAMMGGRNDLTTDLDLHESADLLHARMLEVWPQVAGYAITHTWTGKLGITYDLMPHIGRLNGVWYALGYGGHGLSIGSYMGKEIGQLLTGEQETSPFMDIWHPSFFFTTWDKLYLPFVAAYYRLLDRVS